MNRKATVLVIDDQESARTLLGRHVEAFGHRSLLAGSVKSALECLQREHVDLVITDLRMPEMDGIEGLRQFKTADAQLPVIVLTAHATIETAVMAMKLGAFDYLRKPFEPEEMEIVVARALEHRRLVEENKKLRAQVDAQYRLENLIGKSAAMTHVFDLIRRVGPARAPVLVTGESGTGKDLVARAIHGLSPRARKTFLSLNCAAVPENLLESELFGHEKGAFSGADRSRAGYFREADGGTLFLDEIGDMSLGQQAKLLRVLESGDFIPVGSEQPVHVDVRVIAATNQDLESLAGQKKFRLDLLFRINTVTIRLPPLRERREDIPVMVAHFLEKNAGGLKGPAPRMSTAAMRALFAYDWPGNVRELEHAIEHAVLVADGDEIGPQDLPPRLHGASSAGTGGRSALSGAYREARRQFERDYMVDVLKRAEGNISRAADLAGIHRATFHAKLHRLGLAESGEGEADGQ
jgi:two-component system response regulator AtoC